MARINMEEVVNELDENFSRVLKAVFDELVPDNDIENRKIMRTFRMRLERGFEHWEHVTDRSVDAGY
ncbi:hypothetical protein ACFL6K_06390 [Candidatus Latescibacterota bacterium]